MNLKFPKKLNPSPLIIFFLILYIFWNFTSKFKYERINIIDNRRINWSKEWINKKSIYSGSELRFTVINTKTISLKVSVPNPEPNQEMEIGLEGKYFYLSSPDLNKKELTIHLDDNSYNAPQKIRIRFFCTYQLIPCETTIESLTIDKSAKLLPPTELPKTLSVLGDSISANFGSKNFTWYLADHLGYQLHNASIYHSGISKGEDGKDAASRYKKDIAEFNPDFVLIFMGTNDILEKKTLSNFEESYREIVRGIKKYSPNSKIASAGIIKSDALDSDTVSIFNNTINNIAKTEGITYIDPTGWLSKEDFEDAIHPSLQAQAKLEKGFFDIISKLTE